MIVTLGDTCLGNAFSTFLTSKMLADWLRTGGVWEGKNQDESLALVFPCFLIISDLLHARLSVKPVIGIFTEGKEQKPGENTVYLSTVSLDTHGLCSLTAKKTQK